MNKVYIAGPMRGIPYFNFPQFHAAGDYFKSLGWEVFNPAEQDEEEFGPDVASSNPTGDPELAEEDFGLFVSDVLSKDLAWICQHATHIYMLKGWENSSGARAEHATAVALGLEIIYEN